MDFAAAVRALISVLDGTNIDLSYNSATGEITASITGTLARTNLPSQIAYEDEANTFSIRQNFTAGATIGAVSGSLGQITSASGNTTGWFVIGRAGVTYCLGVMNEASAIVWRVPNSTQNIQFLGSVTIATALDHDGPTVGHRNVTPVAMPGAYTQTYATADRTHAARTAATLTDSSAGTPGTTLAALPNPADSPATADALRDDLVNNILPVLRNWAASLATQHNALKADSDDTAQLANAMLDDAQLQGDAA